MGRTDIRRWTAAAVGGALVLLGAAACGDDDDKSGAKDVDLSKVTFTGDPIKVMTTASYDNEKIDLKDPIIAAQAAADQINLAGGIAGHKVEVVPCNDKADPNGAAACGRKAKAEGVSAVVGGITFDPAILMPILEKAGIPWIASQAVSAEELSSKFSFPLVAGGLAFAGLANKVADDGCKSIAVVRYDIPVAAGVVAAVKGGLQKKGATVAKDVPVPPTATTFDSVAAELSDADCAITAVPSQSFLGIAAATRQAGGKTRFYPVSGTLSGPVLKQGGEALEGTVTSTSFPVESDDVWSDAKAAAPDIDWTYLYTEGTWVGFQVLADVLKDAKAVDAASVAKALNSASAVDTGGFTPALDFTKELPMPGLARVFNPTVTFVKVDGGKFVTDGEPVNLLAALAG